MKPILFSIILVITNLTGSTLSKDAAQETVSKHGSLSVSGVNLVDKNGNKVQLKGMSLFWDIWKPQYYNKESIRRIHDTCHSNVVRAAIAVKASNGEGYVQTADKSLERLYAVIDAAIENDIYVIVDWHDHLAHMYLNATLDFFGKVSKKYGRYPNIIYETFNEPLPPISWDSILKPYHEEVIKVIRANDPNNVIVLGTPNYSNAVDQAAANPIKGHNIMYSLHFYAGTNKYWLRNIADRALNKGLPLFVTEYGTVNSNATAPVDVNESKLWWKWLDERNISYVNWALSDKEEGASAIVPNTPSEKVCQEDYLTESGKLVVAQNKA